MKKYDFNQGWTCRPMKEGAAAYPVSIPHDAMRTEERVATSTGEGNIGWFEGGDYEYVKIFTVDPDLADKKLVLEFESVYHNAEVWVNGRKALYRPYGYTNFYVELNEFHGHGCIQRREGQTAGGGSQKGSGVGQGEKAEEETCRIGILQRPGCEARLRFHEIRGFFAAM